MCYQFTSIVQFGVLAMIEDCVCYFLHRELAVIMEKIISWFKACQFSNGSPDIVFLTGSLGTKDSI